MATATPLSAPPASRASAGIRRWLGWFALAVIVGMQVGTIFRPLGSAGETRLADWVDLLTAYAVVGTAAMVMYRAAATRPQWVLFGVASVTFALGKGLHLSANSISNVSITAVAEATIVHLWDEVVSHVIWFTGLFLLLLSLAWALQQVTVRVGILDMAVAALVAVTLVNNYIEGAQPWLGLVFLSVLLAMGVRSYPRPVARLLLVIGGLGLLLLVGWGLYWMVTDARLFPEFSELGWI
jgi:hypothetical protein